MSEEKKKIDPQPEAAPTGEIGLESLPVTTYWSDVVRRFCKNKIAGYAADYRGSVRRRAAFHQI